MMSIQAMIGKMFEPVISFLAHILSTVLTLALLSLIIFIVAFLIHMRANPFKLSSIALREPYVKFKPFDLCRWLLIDFLERDLHKDEFKEYGFTFYVGRQGAGKTASMVHYLEEMKERYPKCIIVTNFGYYRADYVMQSWRDVLTIRNGTEGVIFAIDEIHSEYSSANWKDVPENLLSEVSQQRKQRVKIVATAQFFTRVAKPLREQAASVVVCKTILRRLTQQKEYDALEYAMVLDNPVAVQKKIKALRKSCFIQSDVFRKCYDTYEKIERMEKLQFIPRDQRGES